MGFSKIWRWFGSETERVAETFSDVGEVKLVLIGFSYDDVTQQTIKWLSGLQLPAEIQYTIVKVDDFCSARNTLKEILYEEPTTHRIEVFCGHGDYDSLLGPPDNTQGDISVCNLSHSVFYDVKKLQDASDIKNTIPTSVQISMFAFCCRAARSFGRMFSSFKNRAFIGFNDDLPLHDDLWRPLREIYEAVTVEIVTKGKIEIGLDDFVKSMYDESIKSYISMEKYSRHPFLMKLYMNEHKRQLRCFV